jgi:hypothetical protein
LEKMSKTSAFLKPPVFPCPIATLISHHCRFSGAAMVSGRHLLAVWATTIACLAPSTHATGLTGSVAIIGGGVGGASAAFYLKRQQPGAAVTV